MHPQPTLRRAGTSFAGKIAMTSIRLRSASKWSPLKLNLLSCSR